jgi:hypothetical protein
MSRSMKVALGGLATAMVVGAAPAYAAKVNDNLQINGKVFADYQSVDGNATSAADDAASGFHFSRAYFETRYSPDADNMFRITLDQKAINGNVFVKYAYWQHKYNDNMTIKFGQNHTPLVDYLQTELWGHRYVAKTYTDAVGAETSADLGISLTGKGSDMIDYYVSYMNGEGYTHTPDGAGSAIMGRVEWHNNGIHVGAFAHTESKHFDGTNHYDRSRQVIYAWWENDQFQVGGQYLKANDDNAAAFDNGSGYNLVANAKLPSMGEKTKLFVRYDTIDKLDNGTDETLTIAGVEFNTAPGVSLAPNVQSADDGTDTVTTVGINAQFKF